MAQNSVTHENEDIDSEHSHHLASLALFGPSNSFLISPNQPQDKGGTPSTELVHVLINASRGPLGVHGL